MFVAQLVNAWSTECDVFPSICDLYYSNAHVQKEFTWIPLKDFLPAIQETTHWMDEHINWVYY